MNPSEKRALRNVIKRLRGDAQASGQVLAALNDRNLRVYLDTWVLGPLELLVKEDRTLAELKLAGDL